ncbi:phosphate/phosphite/phosphonate ABC transporter substrate-binding protein [Pseudodesulfovibrio thermohalotolerans]|uniref:phosphate/phosphite/phosphonate ABC transporter substrate-binding protein n=1 Tax=Pseudodesulfovibrio thermohalotolerans TaxID=2880651 RepID=UPI00244322AE|nr:phosphate/phosphite/phosphonate ABC transporter substrate-binding protein [Pseudodesulfovibrio thermohalotolerans]WFS63098.1 phosphate/phosphite/phosphonate ABC transporter substrate-binding protein [Pseudodesulfovibrio thermohalotolerans]
MSGIIRFLILILAVLSAPALAAQTPQPPLRLGVITLNHPLMMYRQYLPFTDYITGLSGIPVELELAKDYASIIADLLNGKIDIAILGGLSYVEARESSADVTPLCAVLSRDHTPTSRTVIFTVKGRSDLNVLADLKGKSFAFASLHSTAGYLHPLCHLGNRGIAKQDFGETKNLRTHDAVIRSVLRGAYDAGAVSESTFREFAGDGLKVLAVTEPHPGFVLAARRGNIPEIDRLKRTLLDMDYASPDIRARSAKWSPLLRNGFAPVSDADYDPIREMRNCAARFGYRR